MNVGMHEFFPGLGVELIAEVDPNQSTADELVVTISAGDLVATEVDR